MKDIFLILILKYQFDVLKNIWVGRINDIENMNMIHKVTGNVGKYFY